MEQKNDGHHLPHTWPNSTVHHRSSGGGYSNDKTGLGMDPLAARRCSSMLSFVIGAPLV